VIDPKVAVVLEAIIAALMSPDESSRRGAASIALDALNAAREPSPGGAGRPIP